LVGATTAIAVAVSARADAPIDQYRLFDQTDAAIVDNFTGLTWERNPRPPQTGPDSTLAGAFNYCDLLKLNGLHWRVPSYKELLTIVDEVPHAEYENGAVKPKAIDSQAFYGTQVGGWYWTSSTYPVRTADPEAYVVDFQTGEGGHYPKRYMGGNVRCVARSGS
jgi:hypothetical protein